MTEAYFAELLSGRDGPSGLSGLSGLSGTAGCEPDRPRLARQADARRAGRWAERRALPPPACFVGRPVGQRGTALAAEGEQSARRSRGRARRVAGEAVRCLLAPAGDAHQDDGGEWHSYHDHRDRHSGGYPDLMHVSSVLRC